MIEFFTYLIDNLTVTFNYGVQLAVAGFLFLLPLKKRKYFAGRYILCLIAFLLTSFFIPDVWIYDFIYVPFLILAPMMALSYLFMLVTDGKCIMFCVMSAFVLQHLAECVTWIFRFVYESSFYDASFNIISAISYFALYFTSFFIFIFKKKATNF